MQTKILFLVLFAVLACALAAGNGNGNGNGRRNGNGNGRGRSGQGFDDGELQGSRGRDQGRERQGFGGQDDNRRYRSNLYNDDDVYGYDATYPNGEAAYINYRSKDARARRGPEFARTSRAYSRQGGAGERGQNGFAQRNEYGGPNF